MGYTYPSGGSAVVGASPVVIGDGLELEDNDTSAFNMGEGVNDYILVSTADGAEKVRVIQNLEVAAGKTISADTVAEMTAANGVVLDGVRLKDSRIDFGGASTGVVGVSLTDNLANAFDVKQAGNTYLHIVTTDSAEKIVFDKAAHFSTFLFTDGISEESNNTGVTIDGLLIKDSAINAAGLATGVGTLALADNLAAAWTVAQGSNAYLVYVTTDGSESVAVRKRLTTTDGVSSGTARIVGGAAKVTPSVSSAVTGATETPTILNFDSTYTIPPDTLKVGTVVRVFAMGLNTSQNLTENFQVLLRAGSTAICGTPMFAPSGSGANNKFILDVTFTCRATGGSGTITGGGYFIEGADDTTPSRHYMLSTGGAGTSTVTVDTTGSIVLAIGGSWAAGSADGNSWQLETFVVEITG